MQKQGEGDAKTGWWLGGGQPWAEGTPLATPRAPVHRHVSHFSCLTEGAGAAPCLVRPQLLGKRLVDPTTSFYRRGKLSPERLRDLLEDTQHCGDRAMPVAQVSSWSGTLWWTWSKMTSPALEGELHFHVPADAQDWGLQEIERSFESPGQAQRQGWLVLRTPTYLSTCLTPPPRAQGGVHRESGVQDHCSFSERAAPPASHHPAQYAHASLTKSPLSSDSKAQRDLVSCPRQLSL